MEMNFLAILVAAVSSLLIGFVWYHPKVFGNAWMQAAGLTEAQIKSGNMGKIFTMSLLFAFMLALTVPVLVIHQMGVMSLTKGDLGELPSYTAFMADYGDAFRTFKHGAFHGLFSGIFIALPITGITALFERKSAKYIMINSGYWMVTLTIMGAIICGWK